MAEVQKMSGRKSVISGWIAVAGYVTVCAILYTLT